MRYVVLVLLVSAVCLGQAPSVPSEQQYIRFILLNIASLDHDPEGIKAFESHLVKQFGLSTRDSASIHAAGQALRPLLDQNRHAVQNDAVQNECVQNECKTRDRRSIT